MALSRHIKSNSVIHGDIDMCAEYAKEASAWLCKVAQYQHDLVLLRGVRHAADLYAFDTLLALAARAPNEP